MINKKCINTFSKCFNRVKSMIRAYMHPDEVRKREREALPPLKNDKGAL